MKVLRPAATHKARCNGAGVRFLPRGDTFKKLCSPKTASPGLHADCRRERGAQYVSYRVLYSAHGLAHRDPSHHPLHPRQQHIHTTQQCLKPSTSASSQPAASQPPASSQPAASASTSVICTVVAVAPSNRPATATAQQQAVSTSTNMQRLLQHGLWKALRLHDSHRGITLA